MEGEVNRIGACPQGDLAGVHCQDESELGDEWYGLSGLQRGRECGRQD